MLEVLVWGFKEMVGCGGWFGGVMVMGNWLLGTRASPTPPRRALTYPINHGTGKSPAVSDFPLREGRGEGQRRGCGAALFR